MDETTTADIHIDTARWFGDAEIPALPPDLQIVPGFRLRDGVVAIPDGWMPTPGEENPYEDPTWRGRYFDWQGNFSEFRDWTWKRGESNATFAADERVRCFGDGDSKRGCPKYFGAMYAHIQEPRAAGSRTSSVWLPFIPYAFQLHQTDHLVDVIFRPWEEEIDTWDAKSRGLGVSWNRSKDVLWCWSAIEDARIFWMSRNQDLVDKAGNIDALFEKVLTMYRMLPSYLQAPGFTEAKPHRVRNFIKNPVTRAEIIGSANTRDAGRAGRYLFAVVDEAAKITDLLGLLGSLRGSMKKVFYDSTEDRDVTSGQEWLEEWQGAKRAAPESVYEWNWHQNPTMDLEWERRVINRGTTQKQRNKTFLEYFRDVFAGFGQYIYPEASKLPDADYPYDPHKPVVVCTDPGKEDDVAFTVGQTTVSADGQRGFHILFSYQRNLVEVEWMAHLRTGIWPSPEDRCWGLEPTPEERLIGQFFYDRWVAGDPVFDCMDPYGDAALAGYSYKNMLYDKSLQLRAREKQRLIGVATGHEARELAGLYLAHNPAITLDADAIRRLDVEGINALTGLLKKFKTHHQRRLATRVFLPFFTFQIGVPSAGWVRTCLTNNRFKESGPDAVTEPKPVHDQYFHVTSCIEFTMIYYYNGWVDPAPVGPALPQQMQRKLIKNNARLARVGGKQRRNQSPPAVGVAAGDSIGNRYPVHPAELLPY